MNRTIKFRVFDTTKNSYITDLTNFWIQPDFTKPVFMEWRAELDGETIFEGKQGDIVYEQFTGLVDNNGKEIYEGDICVPSLDPSYSHMRYIIEFRSGCFWLGNIKLYEQKSKYIIGNIHEKD